MRSFPTGAPTSSKNGRSGGGAQYGEVGSGPELTSSSAALSRTVRVSTCSTARPSQCSLASGPTGLRPRLGLSPNSPQHEAGMRIEPPPSPPCATGTIPEATAAAAPPLEPPGVRRTSQGFLVAPNKTGSVTG